jgi:hypothetical protein
VANKPAKGTKAKKLEEQSPTPPMLRTRNLRPNDVGVYWYRSTNDPTQLNYDIVVN